MWAAGDGSGSSVKTGYLGFDMSWTAYWLLKWRAAGLPSSDAILSRCRQAGRLLYSEATQRWDDPHPIRRVRHCQGETVPNAHGGDRTGDPIPFRTLAADQNPRYLEAGLRALHFLEREVIPQRKWYDYETFFSCSPRTIRFDQRTQQWPANNLALIPSVAAYLLAYRATGKSEFRTKGEALLDYLLLYQQCWTNPRWRT